MATDEQILIDRIVELERKCVEWEQWLGGVRVDFSGLVLSEHVVRDWDWIDAYRPPPSCIRVDVADG